MYIYVKNYIQDLPYKIKDKVSYNYIKCIINRLFKTYIYAKNYIQDKW